MLLQLISERLILPDCTGEQPVAEHELAAVSKFFSRACVPGRWAPDEVTDQLFSEWGGPLPNCLVPSHVPAVNCAATDCDDYCIG